MAQTAGRYKWPVPALSDLADGPAGFSNLGNAAENTVTGVDDRVASVEAIKTGSPFDVKVGVPNSTNQQIITVQRLVGTDLWEMRIQVNDATDPFVFGTYKGGVKQARFSMQPTGQIMVDSGGTWRPIPFAIQVKNVPVPVAGVNYGTAKFALQAGRFTAIPYVWCTSTNSLWLAGKATGWDITGGPVFARNWQNQAGGAGGVVDVFCVAIQMTPNVNSPEG